MSGSGSDSSRKSVSDSDSAIKVAVGVTGGKGVCMTVRVGRKGMEVCSDGGSEREQEPGKKTKIAVCVFLCVCVDNVNVCRCK